MIQELLQQSAQVAQDPATITYMTGAGTVMLVQKWLKTQQFYATFVAAFPGADKWAHRFVGLVGSLLVAAGIHWNFEFDISKGGTISATLPPLIIMLHGVWDWFRVFIMQHLFYTMSGQHAYRPPTEGVTP